MARGTSVHCSALLCDSFTRNNCLKPSMRSHHTGHYTCRLNIVVLRQRALTHGNRSLHLAMSRYRLRSAALIHAYLHYTLVHHTDYCTSRLHTVVRRQTE